MLMRFLDGVTVLANWAGWEVSTVSWVYFTYVIDLVVQPRQKSWISTEVQLLSVKGKLRGCR
jgi:hypothetical protein